MLTPIFNHCDLFYDCSFTTLMSTACVTQGQSPTLRIRWTAQQPSSRPGADGEIRESERPRLTKPKSRDGDSLWGS